MMVAHDDKVIRLSWALSLFLSSSLSSKPKNT